MVKSSFDRCDIRGFLWRQEEFYAVKAPFPDSRKQSLLLLADAGRPHHRVDAIFHLPPPVPHQKTKAPHWAGLKGAIASGALRGGTRLLR